MLIKTLKNNTIFLCNDNLLKIIDIKRKIQDIIGFPIVNQKLYNNTKLLEDNKELSYYNLSNMSLIEMTFSLNGGGKGAVNNRGRYEQNTGKRELVLAIPGETTYAIVQKICGNKRVIVIRIDNGLIVTGRISGSIHAWVKKDDLVLIGLRDFQEDKVDVIWRYTPEESRKMMKAGNIPKNTIVDRSNEHDKSGNIEFNDNIGSDKKSDDNYSEENELFVRRYDMPPSDSSEDDEQQECDLTSELNSETDNKTNKNSKDDINIDDI